MKKGFTLIELMIVIAIIAIIAAIAIPSLIKSKIAANEGAAAGSLKTFNGMLATYRQKRYAGLGMRYPYATGLHTNAGKFAGLYFEVNNAGQRVTLIGAAEASADAGGYGTGTGDMQGYMATYIPVVWVNGPRSYLAPVTFELNPKQGYWFGLCRGNMMGFSYNMTVARNRYAMLAAPSDYGSSGENTYVINEQGTVYAKDFGTVGWIDYPGQDPTAGNWFLAN